jgi:predicted kinase
MKEPLLVIVNGLPASGKTTLANRLSADLALPVFSRDGIYETLYDALDCQNNDCPPLMGSASFRLLYAVIGSLLAVRQSLIVEGFFGRPELRTAEFLQLQNTYNFEPFQILCKTDGKVLLERFLTRMTTRERHKGHRDQEWIEQNKERVLQGKLSPLALEGQIIEINTTTPVSFDYDDLLSKVRTSLGEI